MRQIQAEDAAYEFERGFVNDYLKYVPLTYTQTYLSISLPDKLVWG